MTFCRKIILLPPTLKGETNCKICKRLHTCQLNIQINNGDIVEPALDTQIDQDQFRINVYRSVPVTIIDGNQRTATASAARTPRAIAQQAGTQMYPEDRAVTTPANDFLKTGSKYQ